MRKEQKKNHRPGNDWFSIWSRGGSVLLPRGKYRISRNIRKCFNAANIDTFFVPSKFFSNFFSIFFR